MNWLHYLLEANLYLMVFYTGYCLFLNKETYYTLNRIYLLLSCIISFLLPLLQVGILKPVEPATQGTMVTVIAAPLQTVQTTVTAAVENPVTIQDVLFYAYLFGVVVLTVVLLIKLFKLVKMTRVTHKLMDDQYKMVSIDDSNTAFSFFNYLFIGSKTAGSDIIIRHELVHIRQKHSVDIIFMEVLKIINWFNPFIYLMQVSLKTVHEYIADEQTAAVENDALTYSSFLVNNAYGLNGSSITHSFFNYNLLKKRIIMLNQKRSGNLARLKYLIAVPICAGMLCASTLGFSKSYGWVDLAPQKTKALAAADTVHKSQHPKVPKYMLQPPPPPTAVKDGYVDLFNYLNKTINYPKDALKAEKAGLVAVSFNIKSDHKLSDIKITKKAADEFNNEVLKAFLAYNGAVTEKPGEHKMTINFCTDYRKFEKSADAAFLKKTNYDLNMIFYNEGKYPVMPPPQAPASINKKALNVPPPPPPASPVKTSKVLKEMPAAPKDVKAAPNVVEVKLMPPPPPSVPFDTLYRYLGRHILYPTIAYNNHFAGRIIATININNGKIEDVKLARGLYDPMDAEVLRVIKNYDGPLNVKSGKYSIPVSFSLVDEKGNYVGRVPEYSASAINKNKLATNDIVVESGPVYSLREVVITGFVK